MTKPVEHYLLTLDLMPTPVRMHSYVMTNDQAMLERVGNRMVDEGEKLIAPQRLMPILLSTKLDPKTTQELRVELSRRVAGAEDNWKTATDFHLTMWALGTGDPWDKTLMGWH